MTTDKNYPLNTFFRFLCLAIQVVLVACSHSPSTPTASVTPQIPERRAFPVNPAMNPCDDFYEYACSKVIEDFKLPADRSVYIFAFHDSAERLLKAKKEFLADLGKNGGKTVRQTALKNFFQACMDSEASASEERENVARILAEVDAIKTHAEFQDYLQNHIDKGYYAFVDFMTLASLKDSDRLDVLFSPQISSLPEQSFYLRPEILTALSELGESVFSEVGLDKPKQRAEWVAEFEKKIKLSEPTPPEIRKLQVSPTVTPRDEFLANYPALKLDRIVGRMPKDTKIRHWFPETFTIVNEALITEPLDKLKSVYLFHALPYYMDDAYPEIHQQFFDFRKAYLGGPEKRPSREERCTRRVMSRLGRELDAELLPILFPDFPEQNIVSMAGDVRKSLIQGIESNQWLSKDAQQVAKEKLQNAKLYLVKPHSEKEWDFNPVLEYSENSPYANNFALTNSLNDKAIQSLFEARNRERWAAPPLTVNAYYSPSDNKFILFQGILQYPFFDPNAQEHINLGSGGMVVAHELGHAIDDQGSRYDIHGNTVPWMSEKDLEQFQIRGQGLVEQFNQAGYNGELELGENIADLVGLTFAYQTAFPNGKGNLIEKQDFFIQYARNWCTVIRPSALELQIKTNPHAPGKGRVNEQVKHQAGFQEAFECKAGDPMVLPADKRIKIW